MAKAHGALGLFVNGVHKAFVQRQNHGSFAFAGVVHMGLGFQNIRFGLGVAFVAASEIDRKTQSFIDVDQRRLCGSHVAAVAVDDHNFAEAVGRQAFAVILEHCQIGLGLQRHRAGEAHVMGGVAHSNGRRDQTGLAAAI